MAQKKNSGSKNTSYQSKKMAASKSRRSGGKTSSGTAKSSAAKSRSSKASTSKKTTKNRASENTKANEKHANYMVITLIVLLVVAVVLFISNLGKGGPVGGAISTFFFGVFGILSYAFPILLFFLPIFILVNRTAGKKSYRMAIQKTIAIVLIFVFLCVFAFLIHHGGETVGLATVYKDSGFNKAGGGVLGALIGCGFLKAFSLLIAYVLDILILILSALLFMGNDFMDGIVERIANAIDDRTQMRDIERAMEREQRQLDRAAKMENRKAAFAQRTLEAADEEKEKKSRRDHKVSGVALDTKVEAKKDVKASQEIKEIDMDAVKAKEAASDFEDQLVAEALREEEVTAQQSDAFWNRPEPTIVTANEESDSEFAKPDFLPESGRKTSRRRSTGSEAMKELDMGQDEEVPQEEAVPVRARNPKQSMEEVEAGIAVVNQAIAEQKETVREYVFPSVNLLNKGGSSAMGDSRAHLKEMSEKLQLTLNNFGVNAHVTNVTSGPAVTQYEIQPEMGVKVSKIVNLADDIKLNLAVSDIRIEAPIPGKAAIGIEVPNKEVSSVPFRSLIESPEFKKHDSNIAFCAGRDIAGRVIVADIAKMPHVLIAGATGSGKSVCINTIIMSILYKAKPEDVKLIMIDPKVVELSVYNGIPHLLIPVVTDPKQAAGALHWAVAEMTDRYNKFAEYGVRDIKGYNRKVESIKDLPGNEKYEKMPQIVVIVDELADLMMVAPGDVEDAICRLAQLARAAGIHLIIATQRPSVNVITGLIKANMPSRIAFSVTSGVDSRTILDMNGAEKLLGKGDMLYYPQGMSKPLRVQGAFVSDEEVADVVSFIIENNGKSSGDSAVAEKMNSMKSEAMEGSGFTASPNDRDQYFAEAGRFIIEKEKGSIGMLQRMFRIGFNRAARIMDQLEEAGVVGPEEGTKPRRVLMTMEEFEAVCNEMD